MAEKRIVVGYVRVSTMAAAQETSHRAQHWELSERLKCNRVIEERISANGSKRRPGWEELRGLVATGQVSKVVVADLARLARDGSDQQFLEECHLVGTKVVDVHGVEYENHTVGGLLTSGVLSLVNKAQSRIIGLRVSEGNRRKHLAGRYGRGPQPFGYGFEDGHFIKHPEHWVHARWLVEEVLRNDLNISKTVRELPESFPRRFVPFGLKHWLRNPLLRGGVGLRRDDRTKSYEEVVWGVAPVLISPQEWDTISRGLALRGNTKGTKPGRQPNLFTGLIRCDECGKNLWFVGKNNRRIRRYHCGNVRCLFYTRGVREEVVLARVKQAFTERAASLAIEASRCRREHQPTKREMELRSQLEQLEQLQREGITGLGPAMGNLQRELNNLDPQGSSVALETYRQLFEDPTTYDYTTPEELRILVVGLVDRIEFHGSPNRFTVVLRGDVAPTET